MSADDIAGDLFELGMGRLVVGSEDVTVLASEDLSADRALSLAIAIADGDLLRHGVFSFRC